MATVDQDPNNPRPQQQQPNMRSWASALRALTDATVGFSTGIPSLKDLTRSISGVSGALGFLESGLESLQGFSSFGVNFRMSITEMISAATDARMSLPELAAVVSRSSAIMTRFGPTVEEGLNQFLSAQRRFYQGQDGVGGFAAENLQRLGFSVREINDTFLAFDAVQNSSRRREQQTVEQRNRSAYEFALELDRLAKLTGMERKQLAERLQANLREGNVLAARARIEQDYGREMASAFDTNILTMEGFGTGIGNLTKDILTRGFPVGESRQLAGVAQELTTALYDARRAQMSGDVEEYNRQMRIAAFEAARLGRDERVRRLSELSGYNEIGNIAGRVFVDTSQGLARAMREIEDAATRNGEVLSREEILSRARARVAEEQAARTRDAGNQQSEAVTQMIIQLRDSVYRTSAETQRTILDRIFRDLGNPANSVRQFFQETIDTETRGFFERLDTGFNSLFSLLGISTSNVAGTIEAAQQAVIAATASTDENIRTRSQALATQIAEYNRLMQNDQNEDAARLVNPITTATTELNRLMRDQQSILTGASIGIEQATVTITNGSVNAPGHARGTLGTTGRLFENFGTQSLRNLHGLESVQTPEQTAAIMRNSALGALQAVGDIFNPGNATSDNAMMRVASTTERLAGTQVRTLQGMLNTITSRGFQNNDVPPTIDVSPITEALRQVTADMKMPVQDVVKAIREPMERLARTAEEQLTTQQRQLKGIKGMNGDIMRGLG